jgi:hypothetical protein
MWYIYNIHIYVHVVLVNSAIWIKINALSHSQANRSRAVLYSGPNDIGTETVWNRFEGFYMPATNDRASYPKLSISRFILCTYHTMYPSLVVSLRQIVCDAQNYKVVDELLNLRYWWNGQHQNRPYIKHVWMYVCMYECMYVCTYLYVFTYVYNSNTIHSPFCSALSRRIRVISGKPSSKWREPTDLPIIAFLPIAIVSVTW